MTTWHNLYGFSTLPELKQASELICDDGDGVATWYVTPLAKGFLAWESVSDWHEEAETRADALAMIDCEGEQRDEAAFTE